MTKAEARAWAHGITIKSLRRKAAALTAADISKREVLTPKQVEKCKEAMRELADRLEAKLKRMQGDDDGGHGTSDAAAVEVPEGAAGERPAGVPDGDAQLADDSLGGGDR